MHIIFKKNSLPRSPPETCLKLGFEISSQGLISKKVDEQKNGRKAKNFSKKSYEDHTINPDLLVVIVAQPKKSGNIKNANKNKL
jgi:hypothetical protein